MQNDGKQLTEIEDMLNDMNDIESIESIMENYCNEKCLLCPSRMNVSSMIDEIIAWKNRQVEKEIEAAFIKTAKLKLGILS